MPLETDLQQILPPTQIKMRPIDRIAYASDASFYRLIPQAVVQPRNVDEVRALFAYSRQVRIPLTFRAAGTSLSGQAITDGILVDVSKHWRTLQIEQNGDLVHLGPGIIGSEANLYLKAYHRRIGPDPASIDAAMLGGMIANNASGMCCGVQENSYHTLSSITFVLPNGVLVNTADPHAAESFEQQASELAHGIAQLRDEIRADGGLVEHIRAKYRSKNTTGYGLNAFIDFDRPVDIFAHLLVGSEGTLAFIAEVVLRTLPTYPLKYTSLLVFKTLQDAAAGVFPLRDSGARAIEFMDRAALRSVENEQGIADLLRGLPESAAALLVEYQSNTEAEMATYRAAADQLVLPFQLVQPAHFTAVPAEQALLWKVRKGLYPSIGGMRRQGTTVLIEDVVFPVERLAEAVTDLQMLMHRHNYPEGIIFGHAKDGNLHFVLTPSFNDLPSIQQYERFIADVVTLVVEKYDGALKAEHGTGRNMAPFVASEWGREVYGLMARLKALADPEGLLNPGVIINPDPQAHIRHLKPWPVVEEEVNKCIECGFCEPKCPSRDLTLTPRRRIVVRREITRLTQNGEEPALLQSLLKDYQYDGLETCAADGYCAIDCPVHINTGLLVKRLRAEQLSPKAQNAAVFVADNFAHIEGDLRLGVTLGHFGSRIIGVKGVNGVLHLGEKAARTTLPKWSREVPRANFKPLPRLPRETAQVVYFPTCISRVMGSSPKKGEANIIDILTTLSQRAGLHVWIPEDSPGNCCGMPFSSKGFTKAFRVTLHRTLEKFWDWSDHGRLPVVIDSSSCAYTLLTCADYLTPDDLLLFRQMRLLDPIQYAHEMLLPNLKLHRLPRSVMLHPNCSAVKLGLKEQITAVAQACADQVTVPEALKCCGFAGDRGLLFPELTASASLPEAQEVLQAEYDGYYSSNLTCEMGMTRATGKPYQSILYLVEEASR